MTAPRPAMGTRGAIRSCDLPACQSLSPATSGRRVSSIVSNRGTRGRSEMDLAHTSWSSRPSSSSIAPARAFICSADGVKPTPRVLTADEPPLLGRRPIPSQHVTHSRMAPPPGSRSRHRIDSCAHATPDPIHPASGLSTEPTCTLWSADRGEDANQRRRLSGPGPPPGTRQAKHPSTGRARARGWLARRRRPVARGVRLDHVCWVRRSGRWPTRDYPGRDRRRYRPGAAWLHGHAAGSASARQGGEGDRDAGPAQRRSAHPWCGSGERPLRRRAVQDR